MALAASMEWIINTGPAATTLEIRFRGAGTAAGVGEGVAGARVLAAPNPSPLLCWLSSILRH